MANKNNVRDIKSAKPTAEELEQELIEAQRGILDALNFMRKIQILVADTKNVSDTAMARAEKWWRYEIENLDRVEKNLEGGKYVKRVRYNNVPQGEETLELLNTSMDRIENITSPDSLVELETEKDGE